MQQNQSPITLISEIVIAAALGVIALFIVLNAGNVIRMWGIDTCYKSSITVVKNTDGSSWSGPNNNILKECFKTKDLLN